MLLMLTLAFTAAGANILGGYVVTYQKETDRFLLRFLLALGAGFLLAAAFLVAIPASSSLSSHWPWLLLGGYMFMHLAQHTIAPHFHFGEETHHEPHRQAHVGYAAVFGMTLHAFFDGTLIASGLALSNRMGILLFVAVLLHKIPEGFTAASIMRAAGRGRRAARFSSWLIALATLAGVFSLPLISRWVHFALPVSAGVTLYVAASDLIPEVNKEERLWVSGVVFLGVIFFFLTEWILELAL